MLCLPDQGNPFMHRSLHAVSPTVLLVAVLLAGLAVTPVRGQTNSALMVRPWPTDQFSQNVFSYSFFPETDTDTAGDHDAQLSRFEAGGRFRVEPVRGALSFGYTADHLEIDSPDPALPSRIIDVTAAAGIGLGQFQGWEVALTAGIGYAGDTIFDDSDALYAVASAVASYDFDSQRSLLIAVDYDGNRAFMPDVPLPAIIYQWQVDDALHLGIGLPRGTLRWQPPDERFAVRVIYTVPVDFQVNAEYFVTDEWTAFATFDSRYIAGELHDTRRNDRVMFFQRRLEAGAQWAPCDYAELIIAGGYAFSQEFMRGFDVRDTHDEVELDDSPYIRFAVNLSF
jgi:hypothetical protein